MLLGRLLQAASGAAEVRLVSAAGGSKDNAIPTAAEAVLCVCGRRQRCGRRWSELTADAEKGVPGGRPRPDGDGGAGSGPVAAHGRRHHEEGDLPAALPA